MNNTKLLSISPRWASIIGGFLICVMLMLLLYFEIDSPYPQTTPTIMLAVTLIYMAFSIVSYDIEERYLVIKYCGIPISRITWQQISCAVYLPEIKKKRGRKACIVLSKVSGDPYIPTENEDFLRRNPFTTIRINLNEFEIEPCIQALIRCACTVHRLDN